MIGIEGKTVTIDYLTLTEKMPIVFRKPIKKFVVTKKFMEQLLKENKANVDIDNCEFFAIVTSPYQKIYVIDVVNHYLRDGYEIYYGY